MLVLERRAQILRLLEKQGSVKVSALSQDFGVTEETIRRDLEELERQGHLRRTYGGAVYPRGTGYEPPFASREVRHRAEKEAIAAAAAALVAEGETVALDASSTTLYLARALAARSRLTIITNSVRIIWELAGKPGLTVIASGGTLRENSLSLVGPIAERVLREYHPDKAFLSCKGLTLTEGLMDTNDLEVELKRALLAGAKETTVLVDSSKFGCTAFVEIAPLLAVRRVITDGGVQARDVAAVRQRGIEVIVATVGEKALEEEKREVVCIPCLQNMN